MDGGLPLPTLLSQPLVAFAIEFDNEFERQAPHRTSNHGKTHGATRVPWLVSMAMWVQFLRFVPDDGISAREFKQKAQVPDEVLRMWVGRLSRWWGYLVVERDNSGVRIRPSPAGRKAFEVWRTLAKLIEKRWRERLGSMEIDRLRNALRSVAGQFDVEMPDSLPILGYGLFSGPTGAPTRCDASDVPLPALLSKVLLAFAVEFESESEVSLAICANVVRLGEEKGARIRDLPRLSGVSKEAIAMATGYLERHGFATVGPEAPGSRTKVFRLNAKGRKARDTYFRLVRTIEERWRERFGEEAVARLRESLERLVSGPSLFEGIEPYPDGWRAAVRKPDTLPYYPMILHRGGFPDGS